MVTHAALNTRIHQINTQILTKQSNDLDEAPEPLSMSWPKTGRKRLSYVLVAPILVPLWLTLPDTRTPRGKKFFPVTFIGSIAWIAAYSYLMVWWANVFGETADIPAEVIFFSPIYFTLVSVHFYIFFDIGIGGCDE